MRIVAEKDPNMGEIVNVLNRGGLIVFPCETVYGVAVDASNPEAVVRLNKYKQRPFGKPYAIMVADRKMAERYVDLNDTAKKLYKNFLPGPLTVISQGLHKVAPGIESESGTLGVRIPKYEFMLKLISQFGRAIVATSANRSYEKRPYKIQELDLDKFDLVIDAGELEHNEPSTVIDTTMDDEVVIRQGEIAINDQLSVTSYNEEMTRNAGKEFWQKYEKFHGQRAIVFALQGEMGAGKTQLTKGLAKAMGIIEEVVSPTYNIEEDYGKLIHIDTWRMHNPRELEELGFQQRIHDKAILVIEWADKTAEIIRRYNDEAIIVWIRIEYGKSENERIISWGNL